MFGLKVRTVKILNRKNLEDIANNILEKYRRLPKIKDNELYRIDPSILIKELLNLNIEYAHLSLDENILGLTCFDEVDVLVYDEADLEYYLCLDGRTVVVEKNLISDIRQRGRANFTLMHEGCHQILNMLFPNSYGSNYKHRTLFFYKSNSEIYKFNQDWEEWQANTLASLLLMPEELVKKGMFIFGLNEKIHLLNRVYSRDVYERFASLADFLGVSKMALAIRMKQLGLLEYENLKNPNKLIEIE